MKQSREETAVYVLTFYRPEQAGIHSFLSCFFLRLLKNNIDVFTLTFTGGILEEAGFLLNSPI